MMEEKSLEYISFDLACGGGDLLPFASAMVEARKNE
jgi:hypothetical protein